MKYLRYQLFALLLSAGFTMYAQNGAVMATAMPTPDVATMPEAKAVLKEAVADAARQHKKVLLIFHASWCGWCHKMDACLNDPSIKKFFDDNFVISHLTVMESKGKENLENPGGMDLMEKFNGKDQGLPYWVILDKEGKLLFDSQTRTTNPDGTVKGQNMGCPASEEEVAHFTDMLKKSTSLKDQQLELITRRFRQNEAKQ